MSHTMKTTAKFSLLAACAALAILLGVGMGSVFIPPSQVGSILIHRMFGLPMPEAIDPVYPAMIFNMRLPRVLLASPFGLGVSAGAGLGAAIIIAAGISSGLLGAFLMPAVSLSFAMITVVLVVGFATRMDRMLSNTTIVLIGMVVSLFLNAIISMLSTLSPSNAQRISLWTLGSFSMKEWDQVFALAPVTLLCIAFFLRFSREMDVMTFGEEQAQTLGVSLKKMKWLLMLAVAVLTGMATSLVGIIGFVDLIAPHVVRRFFGASHRRVIPAAALLGGTFMVLCDIAARTLTPPREIPIGSITALIGAPFFIYIFFMSRRRR